VARITFAGESLIAQKLGDKQILDVARFIFANVPGLDPQKPIDRAQAKPPASQIVYTYAIPPGNAGYVNPNQVVYSSMLGSDVGDFDWNWMGLESAEGVLFAVAYVPLQQKRKNIPPHQLGNNVTRNILVEFSGAQELTGISIDANTWQHDFTVRLAGIDERERLSNRDMFGRACFFGSALQVEKVGTGYRIKPGLAYVEGVRVYSPTALEVPGKALPTTVWLDVVLERHLNDVVARWSLVCDAEKPDYKDTLGVQHYCVALADLTTQAITDRRPVEAIDGPLVQHFAARIGDYPKLRARATTKADVGLSEIPNAISDDPATDDSQIVASTKAVNGVHVKVGQLVDGTVSAGKASQLANPRKIAMTGAATGEAEFDGTANVSIKLTLADSGIAPGTYPKVAINAKGLVVGSAELTAQDIPSLNWSKITSGKPTTLNGYGITDALRTGLNDQVPRFYSPVPGTTFNTPALEIREAQLVLDSKSGWEYAPRISFHWGGVTAGDLAMTSARTLCWIGNEIYHAANFDPNSKANKATTLGGYGITDGLKRGEYGLGSNITPISPIDTRGLAGGFHSTAEAPTSLANYCSVLNMPYHGSAYSGQIAIQQGGAAMRMFARSTTNAGQWTPTVEMWHTGNMDAQDLVPAGTLVQSFSTKPPPGCLRTYGAQVSRTAFARLFAAIGTSYGVGDGSTTFNLPDTRGLFVRDVDDGIGRDPGRGVGTIQGYQNALHTHTASTSEAGAHYHPGSGTNPEGEHTHTSPRALNSNVGGGSPNYTTANGANGIAAATNPAGSHTHTLAIAWDGAHSHTVTVNAQGGNESRPVNVALYFYIKY
jgi:microcystin-dependent protein